MRQTLHIFRKDARHCWPYIAAVAALMAVNAWLGPQEMVPGFTDPTERFRYLFPFLAVVAWWFTVSAVVHGEGLTGDRQFWVTRPYSWKSLLAAKLLFLAAFVGLPMFLSDCVILLARAFNPLALIPGLLLRQCWLAAFLVLPLVVSALTRTARDLALAGLAFYFAVLAAMAGAASLVAANPSMRAWWIWDTVPWLFPVAGLSLAVWLYARRRTALVRVLAVTLALLAPFLTAPLLFPETDNAVARDDARCRNIAVRFDPGRRPSFSTVGGSGSRVFIFIPVVFSGWPAGLTTFGFVRGKVLGRVVENPVGAVVTSGDGRDWITFYFPEQLVDGAVDLSMSLDISVYERLGSANPRSGGWTNIPGFGSVMLLPDPFGQRYLIAGAALRRMTEGWYYRINDGPRLRLSGSSGKVPASPLTFHFSPVYSSVGAGPVPGTPAPLVLTAERLIATVHRELTIRQIRLADYEMGR
ncbi:MAG TPA: hypothetical protein VKF41_12545 [Bryobacteraceae bacterium]|nr:hypothetical protein [Bryobacteraceae bacterium]